MIYINNNEYVKVSRNTETGFYEVLLVNEEREDYKVLGEYYYQQQAIAVMHNYAAKHTQFKKRIAL